MRKVNVDGFEMQIEGEEPAGECAICGTVPDPETGLRPYGPFAEEICWQCADIDKDRTRQRIRDHLLGKVIR